MTTFRASGIGYVITQHSFQKKKKGFKHFSTAMTLPGRYDNPGLDLHYYQSSTAILLWRKGFNLITETEYRRKRKKEKERQKNRIKRESKVIFYWIE